MENYSVHFFLSVHCYNKYTTLNSKSYQVKSKEIHNKSNKTTHPKLKDKTLGSLFVIFQPFFNFIPWWSMNYVEIFLLQLLK